MRRGPSWTSRFRRLNRALASSLRMIDATAAAVTEAAERAVRSPVRTTRELHRRSAILIAASARLERAARGLSETGDALLIDPRRAGDAMRLLILATQRWVLIAQALDDASNQLFGLQEGLLEGLQTGLFAAEAEAPKRVRRIPIAHLVFARDFLLCRRKRAHDRIASVPLRRRRIVCRATTDAPRRICRGRAPPLSANCLL